MLHTKLLYRPNIGILILRLAVGIIFIVMGYMKFADMSQTVMWFGSIGLGAFWAWVAALVEFIGGIMIVAGIGTQIAGILLAITMIVAITKVTGQNGFMMSLTPIMLGVSSLVIALSGCGKYSACGMMHGKDCTNCKENSKCNCQH